MLLHERRLLVQTRIGRRGKRRAHRRVRHVDEGLLVELGLFVRSGQRIAVGLVVLVIVVVHGAFERVKAC